MHPAMNLGTVLPTAASLRASDRWAAEQEATKEQTAAADPVLSKCERREVGGEVRYYATAVKYAIIGRSNRVRWFEIRGDGHTYACKL